MKLIEATEDLEALVHNNKLSVFTAEEILSRIFHTTIAKILDFNDDDLILCYSGYYGRNKKILSYFQKYDVFRTFSNQQAIVIEPEIEGSKVTLFCKTYK